MPVGEGPVRLTACKSEYGRTSLSGEVHRHEGYDELVKVNVALKDEFRTPPVSDLSARCYIGTGN